MPLTAAAAAPMAAAVADDSKPTLTDVKAPKQQKCGGR
jgi:hypothetical protein